MFADFALVFFYYFVIFQYESYIVSFVLSKLQWSSSMFVPLHVSVHKIIDFKKMVSFGPWPPHHEKACQNGDVDQFTMKKWGEFTQFHEFTMKSMNKNLQVPSVCPFFQHLPRFFPRFFPRRFPTFFPTFSQAFAVEMGKDLDLCGSTATVALIPKSRGDPERNVWY